MRPATTDGSERVEQDGADPPAPGERVGASDPVGTGGPDCSMDRHRAGEPDA